MTIWALRGLRDGVVTTRWPRRPDDYADSTRGPVTVLASVPAAESAEVERLCPAGAIEVVDRVRVDQGRCKQRTADRFAAAPDTAAAGRGHRADDVPPQRVAHRQGPAQPGARPGLVRQLGDRPSMTARVTADGPLAR